jgi:hypothetical protein
MNGRLLIVTLLVMLVTAGLFVGLFAGPIERSLMVPVSRPAAPTAAPKQLAKVQVTPTMTTTTTMPGQMPTNLIAQDTFQRQNQALWGTSSDTNRWNGDANNPNDQTIFSIVNQSGQIANGQGAFNALLGPATTDADVTISAQINTFTGGANLGVALRWQDANNWYKALIDGTHLRVIRDLQGTMDTLDAVPFSAQGGRLYDLRFRAQGAMLLAKVWLAGTQQPTAWMIVTTGNGLNSGQSGIRVVLLRNTIVTVKSFQDTMADNNVD